MKTEPSSPKDLGILFKSSMVRAILAGTKSQTRRLVKFPDCSCGCGTVVEYDGHDPARDVLASCHRQSTGTTRIRNPYRFGRRLWVRETWAVPPGSTERGDVAYRADLRPEEEAEERKVRRIARKSANPWRSSLLMPRWASRIDLLVTSVRVERLQDISEDDAKAEGVSTAMPGRINGEIGTIHTFGEDAHRNAFALLWDGINGKTAPWSSNPWVWVISFRRAS